MVKFWRACPLTCPPFIHPEDLPILGRNASGLLTHPAAHFQQFLAGPRFGDPDDDRFHFSLLPVPYMGDLQRADIFLLLLNPGFNVADYYAEWNVPDFRKRMERNLYQRFEGVKFPFLFLDPELCWHPGYRWWERKLREVAVILARERYRGRYREALRELSRRIAAVELVPYHSTAFHGQRLIHQLASTIQARRHVLTQLRDKALRGQALIIITRKATAWGMTRSRRGVVPYAAGHARAASLGSSTPGGKAMLDRLGLQP